MAIQTCSSSELANAQRSVLAKTRFTAEHQAPCSNLIEKFDLGQGEKQITLPKVGQMSAAHLQEGVEIGETQDIGMATTDLTPSEVGLKILMTYKMIRQQNDNVFKMVGRQSGDAIARIKDTDIIALFSGFSNTAGGAGKNMSFANWSGCAAIMKQLKAKAPIACVHHPYAVYYMMKDVAQVGSFPINGGLSEQLLRDFWHMTFNDITLFHDGNIEPDASDDAVGAMFSRESMAIVQSLAPTTEWDKKPGLRAYEMVVVTDYGVYEIDDGQGLAMTYDAATPTTNA